MGALDLAGKAWIANAAREVAALAWEGPVQRARVVRKDLPWSEAQVDELLEVQTAAGRASLHVELLAGAKADAGRRVHGYWTELHPAHDRLLSLLVVLKRGRKQGRPRDEYRVAGAGPIAEALRFRYRVVCAWDDTAEKILVGPPGLLPLLPFTRDARPADVDHALAGLGRVRDRTRVAELRVALCVFAANVFPTVDWFARIPGEDRMRSTTYDRIVQEGERKGRLELVTELLQGRLGRDAVRFVEALAAVDDERLLAIGRAVAQQRSRAKLLAALEALCGGANGRARAPRARR